MFGRLLKTMIRGVKSILTLKGLLVILLLGLLSTYMLTILSKRLSEPRYIAPPQTTETASGETSAAPRMAIVIVGLGGPGKGLDQLVARLMALNVPMTMGIVPHTSNTRRHAALVGPTCEIDLHLPIAFSRGGNPNASGQINPRMRRRQEARQIVSDIYSVGRVAGIAARGGYAAARTDADLMRIVMTMAKRRNLYFVDMAGNTAAEKIAAQMSLTYMKPDVVLDKTPTADKVRSQVSIAINKAVATKGPVIVLGHLLPVTVNTLDELIPKIKAAGIEFATVSGLAASKEPTMTPSLVPTTTTEPSLGPTPPSTGTPAPTTTPSAPGSQLTPNF